MAKKKVHELAKELNIQSKDIIGFLAEKGIEKKAASNIEDNELTMISAKFKAKPVKTEQVAKTEKADKKEKPAEDAPVLRRPVSMDGRPVSADGRKVILPDSRKSAVQETRKPVPVAVDGRRLTPNQARPAAMNTGRTVIGPDGKRVVVPDNRRPAGTDGRRMPLQDGRRPVATGTGSNQPADGKRPQRGNEQRPAGTQPRPQQKTENTEGKERRPSSSYVAEGYRGSDRKPTSSYVANGYRNKAQDVSAPEKQVKEVKQPVPEVVKPVPQEVPAVTETVEVKPHETVPGTILDDSKTVTLNKMGNVFDNMKAKENARNEQRQAQNNERRPYNNQNQGQSGERRPYNNQGQGGERRPYNNQGQGGERRPYSNQGQSGERRPYNGGQGQGGNRPYSQGQGQGGNRPYSGGQGQSGSRPYSQGQGQGGNRPYSSQGQGQGGNRPYGQGQGQGGNRPYGSQGGYGGRQGGSPYNKDGFDKDKDSSTPFQRSRRNDAKPGEKSSIKSELGKELSKEQRAAAFSDRSRDKSRGERGRGPVDKEEMLKGGKRKDPNRKGAFIMPKPIPKQEQEEDDIKLIVIPDTLTIKELAEKLKKVPAVIVKKLFLEGKMVSVNQEITFEEAEEIALGYDCIAEHEVKVNVVEELMKEDDDAPETLMKRPPVVCVMGHVDHGKTSLLDAIRNTNVTAKEAGGITQHIGAYVVEIKGEKITFLDTPGHEAFTSMRMRGAKSTDIAILVVAADDGVMPQTVEAINHAKAAGVAIIVAVNKIDKPSANIERVKQELTEHSLVAEDWGGDTVFVPVSAKTGEGIEQLLDMILLTAEVGELKANPNRKARGIVIEAELDKGRGPVATILVQKGTLVVGDNIVIGAFFGKVRAMMDDKGRRVKEATPSTPVEILGLNEVPGAGDIFIATESEKEARTISSAFISQGKERLIADTKAKLSLDGLFSQIKAGNIKELNLIIKADVQGSVEAMRQSLLKLSNDEVAVRIIHGGVGAINESDVSLASASNAIIIGFNVKPDNTAKDIAEHEKVDVKLYRVIYNAIEDVEAAMKGMLDPIYEEKIIAHAEIRQVFKASGLGSIAGSFVLDGKVVRNSKARITRAGEQIFEGPVASLKRMKDDVKEVAAGYECGIVFEKFNDIQELDLVEFYIMVEVPR